MDFKEIVFSIGRLHERLSMLGDASDDIYDELYRLRCECANYAREERKKAGLLLCEQCFEDFEPQTSISKSICGFCVDKIDMKRHGWNT